MMALRWNHKIQKYDQNLAIEIMLIDCLENVKSYFALYTVSCIKNYIRSDICIKNNTTLTVALTYYYYMGYFDDHQKIYE